MSYLYENIDLLMYLRYNPRWYKILYYDPDMIRVFINEAKTNLKIRGIDKLEGIKNKFQLAYSLLGLFKS
ncbi:MAG: hypothetical protein IJA65_03400 [Acholeplasmatales bacterium]|nr:hypothetical protein [Acholeplasmatales bacterium]